MENNQEEYSGNDFKNIALGTEDMKSKFAKFIGDYMYTFVAILVCGIYMLNELFNIAETGKTIGEIFADSAISLIIGILIARLLGLQGIQKGEQCEEYLKAKKDHESLCKKLSPYLSSMKIWCKKLSQDTIVELRTQILNSEELEYDKYIAGEYRKAKDLTKEQKAALAKARKLRITPLTASGLIGGETPRLDPYNLGATKNDRLKRDNVKTWISKIALAILFGYFGIEPIVNVSYAGLCWRAVQVVIFIASGFMKYWSNYYLIYNDMVERFKKQDAYLLEFEAWYNNTPEEIRNGDNGERKVVQEVQESSGDSH